MVVSNPTLSKLELLPPRVLAVVVTLNMVNTKIVVDKRRLWKLLRMMIRWVIVVAIVIGIKMVRYQLEAVNMEEKERENMIIIIKLLVNQMFHLISTKQKFHLCYKLSLESTRITTKILLEILRKDLVLYARYKLWK
jgi:predicted aspartyl protease